MELVGNLHLNGMRVIILIFCFISLGLQAQNRVGITIVDNKGEGIAKVHISTHRQKSATDKLGRADLNLNEGEQVLLSHISYGDTSITYLGGGKILVVLEIKSNILDGIEVSEKPFGVFSPEQSHVFDFTFKGDSLLVLTYEEEKLFRRAVEQSGELYTGCTLVIVNKRNNIVLEEPLPDYLQGFYSDPLGQLFIHGQGKAYHLDFDRGKVKIQSIPYDIYTDKIQGLKAVVDEDYYFDNYSEVYPEFSYFRKGKNRDEYEEVRIIRDDFMMELFRSEFKYLSNRDKLEAWNLGVKLGLDKEVVAGFMTGFSNHIYFDPLYAPIFSLGDSCAIIDYINGWIYFHKGSRSDSISITDAEAERRKFAKEIILDTSTGEVYCTFRRNGRNYYRQLMLATGEWGPWVEPYYPYAEKAKFYNGKIYYLYRRTGDAGTTHLFAEFLE